MKRPSILIVLFLIGLGLSLPAPLEVVAERYNGITITEAKVFDERSLTPMLQGLDAQIANLKFYNSESLVQAIGRLQGVTVDRSGVAGQITTTPTPGVDTTFKRGLAPPPADEPEEEEASAAGMGTTPDPDQEEGPDKPEKKRRLIPTSQSVERKTTQPSVSATVPSSPLPSTPFTVPTPSGFGAGDLLAEQTELSYQAINLRLVLQKALSDRLISTPTGGSGAFGSFHDTRKSVLLGFRISVDPQFQTKHARAEVKITLVPRVSDQKQRASIIAMMPAERTYNVAKITSRSSSFGAGAVIQPVSLGFSSASQKDKMFLVKDRDTIALEHLDASISGCKEAGIAAIPKQAPPISFGWQFRPVLDQEAVVAGQRQVFLLASLPAGASREFEADVYVHTHWRRHHKESQTAGRLLEDTCVNRKLPSISLDKDSDIELKLTPTVRDIRAADVGNGNLEVTVLGANFDESATVTLGDVVLTPTVGNLSLRGERILRFNAPARKLATANPILVGRYGDPVDLDTRSQAPGQLYANAVVTNEPGGTCHVKVTLAHFAKDFRNNDRPANLQISAGESLFGLGGQPLDLSDSGVAEFRIPVAALRGVKWLNVTQLFWGPRARARAVVSIPDEFFAEKVSVTSATTDYVRLAITGGGFNKDVLRLVAGAREFSAGADLLVNPTLVTLRLKRDESVGLKELVLTQGDFPALVLKLPSGTAAPKPSFDALPSGLLVHGESKEIEVTGEDLGLITQVRFDDLILPFRVAPDGKTITIDIPSKLTEQAGVTRQLRITYRGGTTRLDLKVEPKKP